MQSFRMLLWMVLLTGVIYPLVLTTVAQVTMPQKARGSMIAVQGELVGSELMGQKFSSSRYFWPRPSASDYSAVPGCGSNLGPTSLLLKQLVAARKQALEVFGKNVPSGLLFASASGVDPHITPQSAYFQVGRIALNRALTSVELERLIETYTTRPLFYLIGVPHVNVLQLNIALDQMEAEKT